MSLAQLNLAGDYLPLLRFLTPQGHVMDVALPQDEQLTTPGVNFERIRRIFDQFPTFSAETSMDCSNFSSAVDLKRRYERGSGNYGRLTLSTGGADYQLRVYVAQVLAVAIPGRLVGGDADNNSAAYVDATWAMRVVESL